MSNVAADSPGRGEHSPKPTRKSRTPISRTALTKRTSLLLPPSMPMDEWSKIGHQIFSISDSSAWWLGDWLVYGQSQYPDRYKRAIEETSLDYQTLRNYAWVARRFAIQRRRDTLSFQHHAELASLPDAEQDKWLDRAARFSWSRSELRKQVRASRQIAQQKDDTRGEVLKLRMNVPVERKQRWQDAAATADQDLLAWIISILDNAASATLEAPIDQLSLRVAQ
ncbi:LmbU family transcriptional regulator [Amycolatopsis anabasis]|uniref:LmbU family transcriptional regulator n=1 Tax=Amycolatopsis anabasis TaxID=1840409 RepID=UPI0015D337BA|nr:LmbU family transcriptional regulator [Amycolatopsis anabasis]